MERQFTTRTLTDLFILFFCLVRGFLDEECCCLEFVVMFMWEWEELIKIENFIYMSSFLLSHQNKFVFTKQDIIFSFCTKMNSDSTSKSSKKVHDQTSSLINEIFNKNNYLFRLPSIRGPRDLTLGGVQKKVFTPNIPTRRVKTEPRYEQML